MNKKNIFIIIFFLIFLNQKINAQADYIEIDYYNKIAEAHLKLLQNNENEAYVIFCKLDSLCQLKNFMIYKESFNFTKLLIKKGQSEKSLKYIEYLIENYGYSLSDFEIIENFCYLTEFNNWDSLKNSLIEKERAFQSDTVLLNEFRKIIIEDQMFRKNGISSILRDSIDNINFKKFLRIINQYGSLTQCANVKFKHKDLDEISNIIGSLVLHFSDSIQVEYLSPIFLDNIKNGCFHPKDYINLIDKHKMTYKQQPLYINYSNLLNDKSKIQIENINKNRRLVGMITLEVEYELYIFFTNQ